MTRHDGESPKNHGSAAATVVPEAIWMPSSRRAFIAWCAQQELTPDFDAPHGQAFVAGYEAGGEDEHAAYLRSAVT